MTSYSRREIIKLAGLAPVLRLLPASHIHPSENSEIDQNFLIIVFDALSALNMNVHGYPRITMPYLEKFLNRSTVYHNHYASAPFTTPGTASLLTGTYPQTNRAIHLWGKAEASFAEKNLFTLFEHFNKIAYTHNPLTDRLLDQFIGLDQHIPRQILYTGNDPFTGYLFARDYNLAASSRRHIIQANNGHSFSLFFSQLQSHYYQFLNRKYEDQFPRGLPIAEKNHLIVLENAIDWMISSVPGFDTPFLGYFHFWPPHSPYNTRRDFIDVFKEDGYEAPQKPRHVLAQGESPYMLKLKRTHYDEFILYVDEEFRRLFTWLENNRFLENTWLIFTSDHGEMFERGFFGHTSPSLHQPVLRIPLIISQPGQTKRQDVYTVTSAVDILPTLLYLAGLQIPSWVEGVVLPPFNNIPIKNRREIYALMAKDNPVQLGKLSIASAMLLDDDYKLTVYYGYDQLKRKTLIELYDLENDPQEMNDLSQSNRELAEASLEKLMEEINRSENLYKTS